MRIYSQIKRIACILFSICAVLFFGASSSYAKEGEDTSDDTGASKEAEVSEASDTAEKNGIIKVITVYMDGEGNVYYAKQGTGFVVGVNSGKENAQKYILTDYGIVQGDATITEAIRKKYGFSSEVKFTICYYAVGDMGVLSELSLLSYSNETRYAVLQPSSVMADKICLKLGKGNHIESNARIRIEGYTGSQSLLNDAAIEDRQLLSYSTVITEVVEESYYNEKIKYFYVGESIDEGMAGAPVFDENGCIVGMFILNNGSLKAMSVDNIITILESLNINYLTAEDDAVYDIPTVELKNQLETLVRENKEFISSINRNYYTETTWENLYNAIAAADEVSMEPSSTAKKYQDSIATLNKCRKKLRNKNFKLLIFNIVLGLASIVLVILFIRAIRKRKKLYLERG